jgi:hypothetical protein
MRILLPSALEFCLCLRYDLDFFGIDPPGLIFPGPVSGISGYEFAMFGWNCLVNPPALFPLPGNYPPAEAGTKTATPDGIRKVSDSSEKQDRPLRKFEIPLMYKG